MYTTDYAELGKVVFWSASGLHRSSLGSMQALTTEKLQTFRMLFQISD